MYSMTDDELRRALGFEVRQGGWGWEWSFSECGTRWRSTPNNLPAPAPFPRVPSPRQSFNIAAGAEVVRAIEVPGDGTAIAWYFHTEAYDVGCVAECPALCYPCSTLILVFLRLRSLSMSFTRAQGIPKVQDKVGKG